MWERKTESPFPRFSAHWKPGLSIFQSNYFSLFYWSARLFSLCIFKSVVLLWVFEIPKLVETYVDHTSCRSAPNSGFPVVFPGFPVAWARHRMLQPYFHPTRNWGVKEKWLPYTLGISPSHYGLYHRYWGRLLEHHLELTSCTSWTPSSLGIAPQIFNICLSSVGNSPKSFS